MACYFRDGHVLELAGQQVAQPLGLGVAVTVGRAHDEI
jgi:hypothetical protein